MTTDDLIKRASESLAITFGTNVPYAIGRVAPFERGFAHIRSITVSVDVPERGRNALVPIARQVVAAELASHGFTLDSVELRPTTGERSLFEGGKSSGMFHNENASADCAIGARKRGLRLFYHFEVCDPNLVAAIRWTGYRGEWKEG